ncbi:hypothetical protein [Roseomonas chloroacetimidivorans]|uniref:hypothetical protein n=1 Tax=Roseomonas chloroacetimidivorans TaxID=1766656 RepID=UPI003C717A18
MEPFIAGAVLGASIGLCIGWAGLAIYRSLAEFWERECKAQRQFADEYRRMLGECMHRHEPLNAVVIEFRLARRGLPPMLRAPSTTNQQDPTP